MVDRAEVDARAHGEQVLREVFERLSHPELLIEKDVEFVNGWVEDSSDGIAVRVVYSRQGDGQRFGYRVLTEATDWADDPSELAAAIADNVDEPLGRQWDLLVEEAGVWWWGDGYPGLDQHPDAPALEAFMQAELAHRLHGAPAPKFPFAPELPPGSTFVVTADDSADPKD